MASNVPSSNSTTSPYWEITLAHYVSVYGMFIIGPIGVLTNIFAFLTFNRYKHQSTTTVFLQALAIAHLFSLFWDSIISSALPSIGVKTENSSNWACKIGTLCNAFTTTAACAAIMAVATDRHLHLKFPAFSKTWCTKKSAFAISVAIWFYAFVICLPMLYFFELSETGICTIAFDEFKQSIGIGYELFLTYGTYSAFPMICIVITNVSVVKILRKRKKHREQLRKANKDSDDISWLMVIDCTAFAISTSTAGTLWALAWRAPENNHQEAVHNLLFALAQFVNCVDESINFFLYLIFSKNFCFTFLQMMKMNGNKVQIE